MYSNSKNRQGWQELPARVGNVPDADAQHLSL